MNYKKKHQQETGAILHVGKRRYDPACIDLYVIVYNFCHAHITKFCWNLVTLQLNSFGKSLSQKLNFTRVSGSWFLQKWLRFCIDVWALLIWASVDWYSFALHRKTLYSIDEIYVFSITNSLLYRAIYTQENI